MQLNADDITGEIPDVFAAWPFERVQGLVKFHMQPGFWVYVVRTSKRVVMAAHCSAICGHRPKGYNSD